MPRKFPQMREDGTFCIIAHYETRGDITGLADRVNAWCRAWVDEKGGRELSGDPNGKFLDWYKGPPYVIRAESDEFWLCFDGLHDDPTKPPHWWKDWLVMVSVGIKRAFPELLEQTKYRHFGNCDDEVISDGTV